MWWCCTGEYSFLPIHAAGDYSSGGECCSDYVVSSHTPTVAMLTNARKAFDKLATKDVKTLLGAVPHPYKGTSLRGTVAELRHISTIIPAEKRVALPPSDDAILGWPAGLTVQTVIDKLPEASILHLACHGVQDDTNPLNSGFILRDNKLTIPQLMRIPLPKAFLAFLSACETAKGDEEHSEQVIHLAAAMLFAGFKSVVATMW